MEQHTPTKLTKKKRGLSLRRSGGRPLHLQLEAGTRPNTAPDAAAEFVAPPLTAPSRLQRHPVSHQQQPSLPPMATSAHFSESNSSLGPVGLDDEEECQPAHFWPRDDSDEDDPANNGGHTRAASKTRKSSSARFFRAIAKKFGKSYKPRYGYLPETEEEQRRNVLQHQIFLELFDGKLHLAPLFRPQRVLDVGTGPGNWVIEFAKLYPTTSVMGIDINQIRPTMPAPWAFKDKFDFIHVRMLGDMHTKGQLIGSIYNNLNPGGWLEMTEWIVNLQSPDHSLEGTAFQKWNYYLQKGLGKLGTSVFYPEEYKLLLRRNGFVHVTERKYAATTNACYPGKRLQRIGTLMTENWVGVIEPLTIPVFGALGWSQEEIDALLVDVKKELGDTRYHSYMTLMTVFCQKPREGGSASSLQLSDSRRPSRVMISTSLSVPS